MLKTLNRLWRILATGFCFAAFGLGGLFLRIFIFPLLCFFPKNKQGRIAKTIIQISFYSFIQLMWLLGILTYKIHNPEKLKRNGLLIIANHPSLIDVVFLMSLIKQPDGVVKSALRRNTFTHGPVKAAEFICNDSGQDFIDAAIKSIHKGNNFVIFPEGTRTPKNGIINLQRGAANIAVRGEINITPVTIRCNPPTLAKGDPWYHVPSRPMHYDIEVHDDINIESMYRGIAPTLAVRQLTDHLTSYFTTKTQHANT